MAHLWRTVDGSTRSFVVCLVLAVSGCSSSEPSAAPDAGNDAARDSAVEASDTTPCTIPPGKTCGTVPQCGCAGRNCDVTKNDGTRECVDAGPQALHDKCNSLGQCAAGLTCFAGNCLPFCDDASGCKGTCGGVPGLLGDVPDYGICYETCDPMHPAAACGDKGGCAVYDSGRTSCTAAGTAKGAATCSTKAPFACAPGYTCLSTGECAQWCRIGTPSDCATGDCVKTSSSPTSAGVEYGVCQ